MANSQPGPRPASPVRPTLAELRAHLPKTTAELHKGPWGAIHHTKTYCVWTNSAGWEVDIEGRLETDIQNERFRLRGLTYQGRSLDCDATDPADYGRLATLLIETLKLRATRGPGWETPAGFVSLICPTAVLPLLPPALGVLTRPAPSNYNRNEAAARRVASRLSVTEPSSDGR